MDTLLFVLMILSVPRLGTQSKNPSGEPTRIRGAIHFEPYEYVYGDRTIQAELGRLVVPERHGKPHGPEIALAFVRLKSTSLHPGVPIVYLAGGPGGSGIDLMKGPRGQAFLAMRPAGDIIALDQRGVGLSQPNLACPGSLDFPVDSPGDFAPLLARINDLSRACAAYWRDRGVDLAAYNVVESAHDLESLRRALGVEKIRLWGSSYGTFLALAAIRHHGAHIERAILSGVEGPDHAIKLPSTTDRQLKTIAKLVAADASLRTEIPDFLELVSRVIKMAEDKPFRIAEPASGSPSVTVGRFDLEQTIMALSADRDGIEQLPRLLLDFAEGHLASPRVQMVGGFLRAARTGPIGSAMSYATDCSAGTSPERRTRIDQEVQAGMMSRFDFPMPDVCLAWNVPVLPAAESTPVCSKLPVLFMSGTLDGRTPQANVADVISGFPKGRHVLVEGAGHGNDLFVSSCDISALMLEYMRSGRVQTDRIQLPALQFR
jgi:pimeloyl-ACP methyl ester carboxylesterase